MTAGAALLFPGQGSQSVGMGRVVAAASSAARDVFARADAALDYPLSRIIFEGPDDLLRQTRWQQSAILACSLALLAAHDETAAPLDIALVTGHSLGLYSALVAAGALALDEAVRLVAQRGDLMQRAADAAPGGMAAVLGLDDAAVEEVCADASRGDDVVVAANYNSPGQVVISGALGALERAITALKAHGARKVVHLPVTGPFHSPLMSPAAAALAPAIEAAAIAPPRYPVIANSVTRPLQGVDEIRQELLGQILAPVRWTAAIRYMAAHGVSRFVDCGPGATLAGLMKRIVPDAQIIRLDEGGT